MSKAVLCGREKLWRRHYFIKDQLGNTRVVLTDEQQQDTYPAATLEDGATQVESNYYTINPSDIITNPPSLPNTYQNNNGNPPFNNNPSSNPTATSQKMYRLNGATGDKTGLGITLRVMSGDNVNIFGKSLWHSNGTQINNNNSLPALDLLAALAGTTVLKNLGHDVTNAITTGGSSVTPGDVTNLLNNVPVPSNKPKAYINWILFDDQFRPVTTSSGFDAVSDNPDQLKAHAINVNITKTGYLYVYASDESNIDVLYDNLQVIHTRGPLLQESHYSPWGLELAGISAKAAGKLENIYKFNGSTERDTALGLNLDETDFRFYDPQIGRFHQQDPLADMFEDITPYAYVGNNPISFSDPLGLSKTDDNTLPEVTVKGVRHKKSGSSTGSTEAPKSLPSGGKSLPMDPTANSSKAATDNTANRSGGNAYKYVPNHIEGEDNIKNFMDMASRLIETGENVTVIGGGATNKIFKGANNVLTAGTILYQMIQNDDKGLVESLTDFGTTKLAERAGLGEYYFAYKLGSFIFTSKYTLTEAFFDAQRTKMKLLGQANKYDSHTDEHKRIIEMVNEEQRSMIGIFRMRLSQLKSDRDK